MTDTMFPDEFEFPVLSDELIRIYSDWYQWVVDGAPEGEPYYRADGLCASVYYHIDDDDEAERLHIEQVKALDLATQLHGDDVRYPFGKYEYHRGVENKTNFLDLNRLAWAEGCLRATTEGKAK